LDSQVRKGVGVRISRLQTRWQLADHGQRRLRVLIAHVDNNAAGEFRFQILIVELVQRAKCRGGIGG